jgi:hypothetical protein
VDPGRENIGQTVQHESGLVGEHAPLLRPEPQFNEVVVLCSRNVSESINSSKIAGYLASGEVLLKQLLRNACLGSLGQAEISAL